MTGTLSGVGDSIGSAAGKAGNSVGTAAKKAAKPAIGTVAAAGLAGGLALGARALSRSKGPSRPRVAIPGGGKALKSVAHEMQEVGREIGKAGFRMGIGDVSMEVQKGNSKEQRDSPLEVLLHGLTNRRSKRR